MISKNFDDVLELLDDLPGDAILGLRRQLL